MRDLETLKFHPTAEKIVDILCKKTQNTDPMFFRILLSYYMSKLASMMRVKIASRDRGEIPINLYAINLAPSGQGKGHSTNIIEEKLINNFRTVFFEETYPGIVEKNLAELSVKRANIKGEDPEEEEVRVKREFEGLGKLAFSFDSGTTAAVKQMRHKLLMAGIGSMNLEIDEIGSNLLGNADVLSTFLELFDVGKVKQKLIKNTKENIRNEEIEGRTPTNLLMFGTPTKLLDGGKTEDEFISFCLTGYARRCFFGYTTHAHKNNKLTAEEIYDLLTDTSTAQFLKDTSVKFGQLANSTNYNKVIAVSKDVSIALIKYRMHCESLADKMGDHEEVAKAEMVHRYFKALKLAGTYAFIDGAGSISEDNLYAAIKMAEESGKAFRNVLRRDKPYVKLAKYIASIQTELTHVDLTENLSFYKGAQAQKADLMQLAIAWGYKNQVIIKRNISNGIEFIKGETLEKTDINKMLVSYSSDISDGYKNVQSPFNKLHNLTQQNHKHWVNHHTINGHRSEANIVPGCNMVVLDVDKGTKIEAVKVLLKEYKFLLHTTKRHTDANHRFRLLLPLNYHIKLDEEDFKEFMRSIFDWLPFSVDTATGQRSRKWLTHDGSYYYNRGKNLLDAMLFIPNTSKNDERNQIVQTYQSLTNLERWFIQNSSSGNRNNQLIRYALIMVDMGYSLDQIRNSVLALNSKLENGLTNQEIESTIMQSAAKAIMKKS